MSSVILRTVKHRLADLMKRPGGLTIETALAQANQALGGKAGPALEVIASVVTQLEALADAPDGGAGAVAQAYGLAGEIVNVAGCLDMPEMFATAYSLCELLDYFRTGPFSRGAFEVHVRTLRLILVHGEGPALKGVVSGLKAVKDRVLAGKLDD